MFGIMNVDIKMLFKGKNRVSYIFLDESGNLGFDFSKSKTSKYFIVTLLFVSRKDPVEKVVKKIFKSFSQKERKFHHGFLHAYKETPKIRKRLLSLLNKKDIAVISLYLNKKKVYTKLQATKHALYNYVTNIVLDRICTRKLIPKNEPIYLIASRRETNKFLNDNFKTYLRKQIENNHKIKIKIEIAAPHSEKCLQAVDMICWAIFRAREHNDNSYRRLIRDRIAEESPLFP